MIIIIYYYLLFTIKIIVCYYYDDGDCDDAEDDEVKIKRVNKRTIITDALFKIIKLEDLFQIKVQEAKEEEIDTVGGLVSYVANKVPNINEVFVFNNQLKFKILEADERRIITLEIKKTI